MRRWFLSLPDRWKVIVIAASLALTFAVIIALKGPSYPGGAMEMEIQRVDIGDGGDKGTDSDNDRVVTVIYVCIPNKSHDIAESVCSYYERILDITFAVIFYSNPADARHRIKGSPLPSEFAVCERSVIKMPRSIRYDDAKSLSN
jgi:hypothetical protein